MNIQIILLYYISVKKQERWSIAPKVFFWRQKKEKEKTSLGRTLLYSALAGQILPFSIGLSPATFNLFRQCTISPRAQSFSLWLILRLYCMGTLSILREVPVVLIYILYVSIFLLCLHPCWLLCPWSPESSGLGLRRTNFPSLTKDADTAKA